MEVAGRTVQGQTSSPHLCDPCSSEGNEILADKYCLDCDEWLCPPCVTVHGRLKATRHHRIVDESEGCIPVKVEQEEDEVTERCVDHPKEFIKYHCKTHGTLNCGHCIVKDHTSCNLSIINEVSREFKMGRI